MVVICSLKRTNYHLMSGFVNGILWVNKVANNL
jgi:hypothetical protein